MLPISRRTVLKGLGAAVALPLLEAMLPARLLAGTARQSFPKRMAFLYVPNGVHMAEWTPSATGTSFRLPSILEPLAPFKEDINILSGLTCDKARPNGDGPGDHARANAAFLTGAQPKKTAGKDIRVGISVDQFAAQKIGRATRFPSLEIGCEGGKTSGNCDSGYSCAYNSSISWRSESLPMPKEINPKLVFERLFSNGVKHEVDASRAKREQYDKSILDFVAEDARQLRKQLGGTDQRKLDEYLSAIREIEVRLTRAEKEPAPSTPTEAVKPTGIPKDFQEHLRLMADMLVLAFQGDLTRIATFVFANDGSNRSYKNIGVSEGHHDISHHNNNKDKLEKIRKINRFHVTQFAYLLEKLKGIQEGESTLLDNCMIVYGSAIADGNRHNHDNLPIILAGKGGNTIPTGRHLRFKKETPLCDLYVTMLNEMGVDVKSFGDSRGRLSLRG